MAAPLTKRASPSTAQPMRDQLKNLLKNHAYSYRKEPFKLKSGLESNHYVDCRPVVMHPLGCSLAGGLLSDSIHERMPSIDIIAGVVLGAVPLVDEVVSQDYVRQGIARGKAYVRPEPKSHGTQNLVELDFVSQVYKSVRKLTAVLLEDVWTTGGSAAKAKAALKDVDIEVVGVIALVDREEPGFSPPDYAVFTLSELSGS